MTRAEPITSPVRWRTGFSKSWGLSSSVSFLPLPLALLSFIALAPFFARQIALAPFFARLKLRNPVLRTFLL